MPILEIPQSDRLGLSLVQRILADDTVFANFLASIQRAPLNLPVISGISPEDAEQIVDTIRSLYRVRVYAEVPVDEFISDVCDALREYEELLPGNEPKMRDRLGKLLNIESFNVAAKAETLQSEHERIFCTARILTDARPVYGAEVKAAPVAMIIGHTLKITYHEGPEGEEKDFYLALRPSDLKELHDLITRAETKEQSLRTALEGTKIRLMDSQ